MVVMGDDGCVMLRNCLEVLVADGGWQVQLLRFGGDDVRVAMGVDRCVVLRSCLKVVEMVGGRCSC